MENNDKIFEQFKDLANADDQKKFPNMDKVWNKVEHKLDKKVLKKETKLWKKMAVAASVLLFASIVYQILKPSEIIKIPTNETVEKKSTNINLTPKPKIEIATNEKSNPEIKKNADQILEKQISTTESVAIADNKEIMPSVSEEPISKMEEKSYSNSAMADDNSVMMKNNKFDSRGVFNENKSAKINENASQETIKDQKKVAPILVIDGEVKKNYDPESDEIETIIELPNPLYIINGEYITEEELFGPNPTSEYYPLKKQKIEAITILDPEKAQKIYGKKGENGIVIVKTKDGKPNKK